MDNTLYSFKTFRMTKPATGGPKKQLFTTLYQTEADAIFRFCIIRTSRREVALDLVQDTFLRLWAAINNGQEIDNHRAFLFTIARNLIIDWYRKKKPDSLEALLEDIDADNSMLMADDDKRGHEMNAEGRFLIAKIQELEPQYRQPVFLRFVEGLSPGEIGKIMGISVNAASVRVNRGLEKLRAIAGYSKQKISKVLREEEPVPDIASKPGAAVPGESDLEDLEDERGADEDE